MGVTQTSSSSLVPARFPLWRRLSTYAQRAFEQDSVTAVHGVEIIYLHILAVLLILGWLGLVLGELGYFSLDTLLALALVVGAAVFLVLRRSALNLRVDWSPEVLGIVPVLLLAAKLFSPPFEFILGAADAGVYVTTGITIARTGSIVLVDEALTALSPEVRDALFSGGSRFDGYYIADLDRGLVVPHAFHLYPTLLAIAHSVGGISATFWATPLIALLSLIGFYLVARRLFGDVVAFAASLFFAVNPAVIWFAHYPAAENLVRLWLFGGLLAFIMMLDTGSRRFALLAGFTLGVVHLTKIEAVMLPVAVAVFFVHRWVVRRLHPEHGYFLAAYGLMLLHAALHAHFRATSYFYTHLDLVVLRGAGPERLVIPAILVVAALIGIALGRNWLARALASRFWARFAPSVGAGAIILLACYAYYVRPRVGGPVGPIATLPPAELYWLVNRMSFVTLGWYVSPLGLLAGTLGFGVALVRAGSARTVMLFTLVFLEVMLHLYEGRVRPVHFWAARRYLPVIFPAFALFSAFLLHRLQTTLRHRWPEVVTPAALGFVMLVSSLSGWVPFVSHVEYRGAVEQIRHLAAQIPEDGIVIFDHSDAGLRLSTPVQFIGERTSLVLWEPTERNGIAGKLIAEWMAKGRDVYWVRTGSPPDVARLGFGEELVGSSSIDLPEVVPTVDRRPDTIGRLRYELQIYRILPKSSARDRR